MKCIIDFLTKVINFQSVKKTLMASYSSKLYPEPDKRDAAKMKEFFQLKYKQRRFEARDSDSDDSGDSSDSDTKKKKSKKEEKKKKTKKDKKKRKDTESEEESDSEEEEKSKKKTDS